MLGRMGDMQIPSGSLSKETVGIFGDFPIWESQNKRLSGLFFPSNRLAVTDLDANECPPF